MPHQSNKALQSQAPKYAFARSASKYEPGKEAMSTTPKGKKPDAWDKGGEYKDYKRTQPSGKPLTRLMKPNQNVKSITSVVVILLSLPAHLDYSSKERKERTRSHCTERKASLYQKGRAYRLQKGWLYSRVVILPYFVLAAIVAVVPFGIVSEVPGFLILL